MQQDTALEQRESCLSIRATFDPLYFIDESFDHAVASRLATPIGDRFCIIGQPVDKIHQFRDPTRQNSCFPLLQSPHAFTMAQKLTKLLGKGECSRDRGITLAEPLNESDLVGCSVLGRPNDHERGTASRRRLLQRDGS